MEPLLICDREEIRNVNVDYWRTTDVKMVIFEDLNYQDAIEFIRSVGPIPKVLKSLEVYGANDEENKEEFRMLRKVYWGNRTRTMCLLYVRGNLPRNFLFDVHRLRRRGKNC